MVAKRLEDDAAKLVESLVGHRIERAEWWDADPVGEWTGHEFARLFLDDGRVVEFGGYGYDAWGGTVSEEELVNVAVCLACGKEHPEQPVRMENGKKMAFCTDGTRTAWRQL